PANLGGMFERAQRRHRADAQPAAARRDAGVPALDAAQADELLRPEHAGLHHQHQSGAAGEGTHGRIIRVEQLDRLMKRFRFGEIERDHVILYDAAVASFSRSRLENSFSMSLALERNTGWPMLPSLPASVASTE